MAIFNIDLPLQGEHYTDYANNLMMLSVSLLFAYLAFKSSSTGNLFNKSVVEIYIYLLLGFSYYHLIVKRVINFQ